MEPSWPPPYISRPPPPPPPPAPKPVTEFTTCVTDVTFGTAARDAADVAYSLDYQSKPGVTTSVYFANVKSIAPDGPETVVITLKAARRRLEVSLSTRRDLREGRSRCAPGHARQPGGVIEATGPGRSRASARPGAGTHRQPRLVGREGHGQGRSRSSSSRPRQRALAMRSGGDRRGLPEGRKGSRRRPGAKGHKAGPPPESTSCHGRPRSARGPTSRRRAVA